MVLIFINCYVVSSSETHFSVISRVVEKRPFEITVLAVVSDMLFSVEDALDV